MQLYRNVYIQDINVFLMSKPGAISLRQYEEILITDYCPVTAWLHVF